MNRAPTDGLEHLAFNRNADGVLHAAFLRRLINFRLGKGRIAPEGDLLARSLLALNLRQQ